MKQLIDLAVQAGFSACYVLRPDKFIHYERRLIDGVLDVAGRGLVCDPAVSLPWANVLLLLLMPYRPYVPESGVSGNYPSSNRAYHAANNLLTQLDSSDIHAERVYVPIRELALRSGIGTACLNGLTAFGEYGTRVAVQTLAAYIPHPQYDVAMNRLMDSSVCDGCGRCIAACPSGAITENGYDFTKCARAYMQKNAMPDWVMDAMTSLLGCEICQFACPMNDNMLMDSCVPNAFDWERLLAGEVKSALAVVGKNLNSGGRLVAHAIVLAAHAGRSDLLPLIRPYADDPRPAVSSAAVYAICRLPET
ncbi:MAG: 4Fe-4S double cluster binding domain-containing protein [Clostridia bacterium]